MIPSVYRRAAATALAALLALLMPRAGVADTGTLTTTLKVVQSTVVERDGSDPVPAITGEEALALVRRYFAVPEGGALEATLENQGSRLVWQIMYTRDQESMGMSYPMGEIDAQTGKVLHIGLMEPDQRPIRTGPAGQGYSEAYARTWAWLLVKDLYPAEVGTLRPAPEENVDIGLPSKEAFPEEYTFTWTQHHGDVPVAGNMVTVTIDKYTLDYISFWANFHDLSFPPGTATVTPAEALQRYRQRAVPQLAYLPRAKQYPAAGATPAMQLVYRVNLNGFVDAVTGRFVDSSGKELGVPAEPEPVPAGTGTVVRPAKLPLDDDTAMAYVRELLDQPRGGQLKADRQHGEEENTLYLSWHEQGGGVSVRLDLPTGLIRSAHSYSVTTSRPGLEERAPLSADQRARVKAAAIAVVQRCYSQLVGDLKLDPQADRFYIGSRPDTRFFFQRYVNGIPAGSDGVHVSIDPETLAWTDISAHWTSDVIFPKPDGVVSPEKAADRFFASRQPLLTYQPIGERGVPIYFGPYMADQHEPAEAMLVYQLSGDLSPRSDGMLDALTGEALDWYGKAAPAPGEPSRLPAGHWAEGELRYLLTRGGLEPERLNPEGTITRAEALQMLTTTLGLEWFSDYGGNPVREIPYTDIKSGDPLRYLVAEGIGRGLLKPEGDKPLFGGDQPVTRAEFATWLVRALKLDGLARSALLTTGPFQDLAGLGAEERNAAAFLQALGIASSDTAFRGSDKLTQAEGAAFTVRLINYLRTGR